MACAQIARSGAIGLNTIAHWKASIVGKVRSLGFRNAETSLRSEASLSLDENPTDDVSSRPARETETPAASIGVGSWSTLGAIGYRKIMHSIPWLAKAK